MITENDIKRAKAILKKYKKGKGVLEEKLYENEKWFRTRHFEYLRNKTQKPKSAWLLNCILNKHADLSDNMPKITVLPREEGDKAEAEALTKIIPVVLDESNFDEIYSKESMAKLKYGTGVYGVFFNPQKSGGIGEIEIKEVNLLNLYFEPNIEDIDDSKNLFCIDLFDKSELLDSYPALSEGDFLCDDSLGRFIGNDDFDTDKAVVVDWYYKIFKDGREILHLCKFVGNKILFASENFPEFEGGIYAHAHYPFVFDKLYSLPFSPCGFGFIDIGRDAQEYIDKCNDALLRNMRVNASPRFFLREDGGINEKEFLNLDCDIVHVNSTDESVVKPLPQNKLDSIYVDILKDKIEELKETTGTQDVSNGNFNGGVTAASAIMALQETSGKISREIYRSSYRAVKKVVALVVELIREFYDEARYFRIIGNDGNVSFLRFNNKNLVDKSINFDFEIYPSRKNEYTTAKLNELALDFFKNEFFANGKESEALTAIEMMDFDKKEIVKKMLEDKLENR